MDNDEDDRVYDVVVNHEEQYSIWEVGLPIPLGWRALPVRGSKSQCLAHIDEVWTDMRPLSLRRQMELDAEDKPGTADRAPTPR